MKYSKLEVFDRWGQRIFNESPYLNNLDTRNLGVGTYYYIFTYDLGKGINIHQSFFEVYK